LTGDRDPRQAQVLRDGFAMFDGRRHAQQFVVGILKDYPKATLNGRKYAQIGDRL